jgi:predicted TIM-barrel fold metal-dependent hydrolase
MSNRFDYRGGEHDAWLASHEESVLEPDLPIIDAHHHLWIRGDSPYLLREFAADLSGGHRVVATVFAECHAMYRTMGAPELKPVGEMTFVAGIGAMSDAGAFGTAGVCRAAVGAADLSLGDAVGPVLDALTNAADGRLRGIRASVCFDADASLHRTVPHAEYLGRADVRRGIAELERRDLVLDCWLYHPQLPELAAIADAFPNLRIVLDHCGTPILGGRYRGQTEAVHAAWSRDLRDLAQRPNVFVKLGALPARFERAPGASRRPPDSTAVATAWRPWIEPCIEAFGAARCLFESNFPVHKNWLSYPVLWNAFKRITTHASPSEKIALFSATASTVYRIDATA